MEDIKVYIRYAMLKQFKNNKNVTEIAKEICIVSLLTTNWFPKFRSGDTSLTDEPRSGRISDIDEDF